VQTRAGSAVAADHTYGPECVARAHGIANTDRRRDRLERRSQTRGVQHHHNAAACHGASERHHAVARRAHGVAVCDPQIDATVTGPPLAARPVKHRGDMHGNRCFQPRHGAVSRPRGAAEREHADKSHRDAREASRAHAVTLAPTGAAGNESRGRLGTTASDPRTVDNGGSPPRHPVR